MDRDRILYFAAAVLAFLTSFAAFASPAGAWPLCIGALACVGIANMKRFSEISAGATGVRAVLREAKEEVNQLKHVVALTAASSLSLVQRSGRWGGFSDKEQAAALDQALDLMRHGGMSADEIARVREEHWDRIVRFDYRLAALGGGTIPDNPDKEVRREWDNLRDLDNEASPDNLDAFLKKAGAFKGIHKEFAEDYRHYCLTRTHRAPERWASRDDVPRLPKPE
jgi:hypothetical protein